MMGLLIVVIILACLMLAFIAIFIFCPDEYLIEENGRYLLFLVVLLFSGFTLLSTVIFRNIYYDGYPAEQEMLDYNDDEPYETIFQKVSDKQDKSESNFITLIRESDGEYRLVTLDQETPKYFIVVEVAGATKILPVENPTAMSANSAENPSSS